MPFHNYPPAGRAWLNQKTTWVYPGQDKMGYGKLLIDQKRIIASGFLLTFFSGFGPTILLSLNIPKIVDVFAVSNSFFGGLFALATVTGFFILVYAGRLNDNTGLRKYSLISAFLLMASGLILISMIMVPGGWQNSLLTHSVAIGVFFMPFIWLALPSLNGIWRPFLVFSQAKG